MQNVSLLQESRVHCGHGDTFSSARRPQTREEYCSKDGRLNSDSNVNVGYVMSGFQLVKPASSYLVEAATNVPG